MDFHYIGNGAYCYANSLAMLLSAVDAEYDPGYLECLTTVAISAARVDTPKGSVPFFSIGLPDQGVTFALDRLGYAFDRAYCAVNDDPDGSLSLRTLREALTSGPVLVGPLAMNHLTYMAHHRSLVGADHFVVLYAIERDTVFLHDPAGFAYVPLPLDDFMQAWRAEAIEYCPDVYPMGSYSMWWNVRQRHHPTPEDVYTLTDQHIKCQLQWQREQKSDRFGCHVIRQVADQVRTGVPEYFRGHLGNFALPLGARRSGDFARFYAPFDPERAQLKEQQARCFSQAFAAFVR